jgi:hypothetical protein
MNEENNNYSISTIIITTLSVIIIIFLSVLFYYFAIKSEAISGSIEEIRTVVYNKNNQVASANLASQPTTENTVDTSNFTKVISFEAPEPLPIATKTGNCWVNSIAQPFREDAWRCMVGNSIYDPCFSTNQDGVVFCQMNPLKITSFIINLTEPLPTAKVPAEKQDNWAWFIKLKDGTYCSPFTGTRLPVGTDIAYYGCNSNFKSEQVVLVGDLRDGDIWKATKAVLVQNNQKWTVKTSEEVDVETVWQ